LNSEEKVLTHISHLVTSFWVHLVRYFHYFFPTLTTWALFLAFIDVISHVFLCSLLSSSPIPSSAPAPRPSHLIELSAIPTSPPLEVFVPPRSSGFSSPNRSAPDRSLMDEQGFSIGPDQRPAKGGCILSRTPGVVARSIAYIRLLYLLLEVPLIGCEVRPISVGTVRPCQSR
jgi:hypothetical protein